MFDYIAYLIAQQRTANRAQEALPDNPVRESGSEPYPGRRRHRFQHGISNVLRWLADRLDPIRECPAATTGCS
jgi:hypothetical protein